MHVIGLRGGPPLERGGIATHRSEVAVVEPVKDGLFLLQAGPALAVGGGIDGVFAQGEGVALLAGFLVVLVDEAGADEDDVADLDVAALGGGPDVDALGFAAGLEVGVGDAVGSVAAVSDVLRLRIGPVVEEEGPTREAVRGPVVDAVFEVGPGAVDVAVADAVVKGVCGDVGELVGTLLDARQEALCGVGKGRLTCMTEAIPLSTALGVQLVYVVIGYTLGEDLDLVREWLTMKARLFGDIERQTGCGLSQHCASLWTSGPGQQVLKWHNFSGLDFRRGCFDSCRCEQIQSANVIFFTPYPSSVWRCSGNGGKILPCRESGRIWIPCDRSRSLGHG